MRVLEYKKCLVIGGNGFIGSHLLKGLVNDGYSVTSLDLLKPRVGKEVDGVVYVSGNYGNKKLIEDLLVEHDCLIHLAYATQPNTSFDNPFLDLSENIPPTVQLFDLAAKHGVRVLFVSSGGTVYGEAMSEMISENHSTFPISPYGVTKLTLEKYAYLYAVTKNLDVVVVRPANPYGEGQKPFSGQGFVATAMGMVLQGKSITIFGEKGTVRDYIYISDLVSGILTVLENGESRRVYNIGSSIGRSNLDVVKVIGSHISESSVDVMYQERREFDVSYNVLDCSELRNLGWQPRVSFDEGVKRMLGWMRREVL